MDDYSVEFSTKRQQLLSAAKAEATEMAIQKQIALYLKWCESQNLSNASNKTEVVEAYFINLFERKLKRSSIDQAKWAIEIWNKQNKTGLSLNSEHFTQFFKGIRRIVGFAQVRKGAFTIDHIKKINFNNDLIGLRDKAMLLIGFSGGMRRSELCNLQVADLEFHSSGLRLIIRRSKTNQYGSYEDVSIPFAKNENYCPVLALKSWLSEAKIQYGPIFRSFYKGEKLSTRPITSHNLAVILKKYASSIGLNPDEISGHSLRSGCATFLLENKVPINIVAKQLRHKRIDTTLKYDRNQIYNSIKDLF